MFNTCNNYGHRCVEFILHMCETLGLTPCTIKHQQQKLEIKYNTLIFFITFKKPGYPVFVQIELILTESSVKPRHICRLHWFLLCWFIFKFLVEFLMTWFSPETELKISRFPFWFLSFRKYSFNQQRSWWTSGHACSLCVQLKYSRGSFI